MRKLGYLSGRDDEGPAPMQPKAAANKPEPDRASPAKTQPPAKPTARSEEAKTKAKVDFPPGLVVSQQAQQKMDERKNKTQELTQRKEEKRAAQLQKWQSRPDVVAKWKNLAAKFSEKRDSLQKHWEEQDRRKAAQREAVISRLTANNAAPAAIEAQKQQFAQEDTVDALKRADELVSIETQELKEVEQAERAQLRKDKFFNMWAGMLGRQKRQIPA